MNEQAVVTQKVKKSEFLKTIAPANVKKSELIRKIASLVCLVILAANLFYSTNLALWDIPVFNMVLGESETDELKDLCEELEDEVTDVEEAYKSEKSELSAEEREQLEELEDEIDVDVDEYIDDAKSFLRKPSLTSVKSIANKYGDAIGISNDDLEIFDILSTVLYVFFGIGFAFALLGTLCRKQTLMILGLIVSGLYAFLFSGTLMLILTIVSFLVSSIFLSKVNKAYRTYKKQF